ncbi:MAG: SemiSWEET family transporter [Candidatus Omnitrophica bacterium]|nr:SemiSWEET family transporter [Candidatus Omnitrophota bacterium]
MDETIWKLIGLGAATLTMFGFVPQIIKIGRTKSAHDVSFLTLCQFSTGVLLWLLYGIHLADPIIILANTVSFFTLLLTIGLYFRYR